MNIIRFLACAAFFDVLFNAGALLALDPPIVLDPPILMDVLSKEGVKSDIRYHGQAAKDGKIDLTATNGFFDRCFEALDQKPGIPGDNFIRGSFGYLRRLSADIAGTARWHLWCAEAGKIKATFFLQVPAGEAGHSWVIKVGEETQTLKAEQNDGESPQKQTLTFTVKQPGKYTFTIDCTKNAPPAETRLYYIRLEGTAVNKASVLRTRWRPLAVHTHFYAPKDCPSPKMWVFESAMVSRTSSYSPLTTPFGYYGTSFKDGGRIAPGAGFNFSLWIAGKTGTVAPPIEQMARLIGTDIPDGEFTTWGGEGTGVRPRATAYKNGADRTIQALRVEASRDGLITYYGYFFDEDENRWKLYVSAQKPSKRPNAKESPNFGTLASTGSFCEIPGPPNRERSGDLIREIKRRGWFHGSDGKWYRATMADASEPKPKKGKKQDPDAITSKRSYYMDNFAGEGWMSMATGGMEYHRVGNPDRKIPKDEAAALPEYLRPEKAARLFELPVLFGKSNASQVTSDQASIDYEIKKTGPNSKAILYYGTVDCLTYPPQKLTKGSPVQIDMYRPERTWQGATAEQKVAGGTTQFKLGGLKGSTTYYYRLYVAHDQGKSWDYQSGSFKTK
jgi:hypothetical protein